MKHFSDDRWKQSIPMPVCEDHPEYTEFYQRAWKLVREHVKYIDGMPQTPYMDEAFCDTQIWIWDSCFMSLFCKYAQEAFPGVETLNNFYSVLYDGKQLPEVYTTDREPTWTKAIPGQKNKIKIHIADNPPLFAFAEYETAMMRGDIEAVKILLYEKQYLQKHYAWLEELRERTQLPCVLLPTRWIREELGYRWEGGRSGMDNTPRGRAQVRDGRERPKNPDLLWLDAICQQALSANLISKLFALVGDAESSSEWAQKHAEKKVLVNRFYWDDTDRFYYDIDVGTHAFCKVKTVASYWPLLAEIASSEQAKSLVERISDPMTFGGDVPLISLARNDGDFEEDGRYWRGSLWLPTAYVALKGLSRYHFDDEVQEAACKILHHMYRTYRDYEPHTIWECYSPTECAPATTADGRALVRADFCGWSALGPISIYIEFILGFRRIDAFENTVEWILPRTFGGEVGIQNLRFGRVVTDITAKDGVCRVVSNASFTLMVDGKSHAVREGENTFRV